MKEEKSLPTLGEFIIEKQRDFKYSTGELSRLISCLQIASKMVNRLLTKPELPMYWVPQETKMYRERNNKN